MNLYENAAPGQDGGTGFSLWASPLRAPRLCAAELLVGAASDLGLISEKLGPVASKASETAVRFTLASSGDLAQQIANGARFDVL